MRLLKTAERTLVGAFALGFILGAVLHPHGSGFVILAALGGWVVGRTVRGGVPWRPGWWERTLRNEPTLTPAEQREQEAHEARMRVLDARAEEVRTRAADRRRPRAEQDAAVEQAYRQGARDMALENESHSRKA